MSLDTILIALLVLTAALLVLLFFLIRSAHRQMNEDKARHLQAMNNATRRE